MPGFNADSKGEVPVPPEVQIQPMEVLVTEILRRCRCGVVRLIDVLEVDNQLKRTSYTQWKGFPHELLGIAKEIEIGATDVATRALNKQGNEFS